MLNISVTPLIIHLHYGNTVFNTCLSTVCLSIQKLASRIVFQFPQKPQNFLADPFQRTTARALVLVRQTSNATTYCILSLQPYKLTPLIVVSLHHANANMASSELSSMYHLLVLQCASCILLLQKKKNNKPPTLLSKLPFDLLTSPSTLIHPTFTVGPFGPFSLSPPFCNLIPNLGPSFHP